MKYLALFLIFLFQAAHAEEPAPWRIAIIGDTHDSPKRMEGSEGVAVNFIKTLYGEILKHQVDMVVQVGDMADIEGSAPVNGLAKRKELNKMLEEKGLIRDADPFYVRLMLTDYKKLIQPGTYTLNTSMQSEEMMAVMSGETDEDEEN